MFFTHFIHFQYHESCYNKQEVYHYNKKNRVPHGIRFSKTNYLKTNLLKQIKKISLNALCPI